MWCNNYKADLSFEEICENFVAHGKKKSNSLWMRRMQLKTFNLNSSSRVSMLTVSIGCFERGGHSNNGLCTLRWGNMGTLYLDNKLIYMWFLYDYRNAVQRPVLRSCYMLSVDSSPEFNCTIPLVWCECQRKPTWALRKNTFQGHLSLPIFMIAAINSLMIWSLEHQLQNHFSYGATHSP